MKSREELRDLLFCDHFESHWCAKCGNTGALYAIPPDELLIACSPCLVERIAELRRSESQLPDWVTNLEFEAKHEIAYEANKEAKEFALDFDSFYKCCRCGKLIDQKDARYPSNAADEFGAIGPHCLDCYWLVSE
jgi:hypothetical protein